jgi:hypothetical protein
MQTPIAAAVDSVVKEIQEDRLPMSAHPVADDRETRVNRSAVVSERRRLIRDLQVKLDEFEKKPFAGWLTALAGSHDPFSW